MIILKSFIEGMLLVQILLSTYNQSTSSVDWVDLIVYLDQLPLEGMLLGHRYVDLIRFQQLKATT